MRKSTREKYLYFLNQIKFESGKYRIDEICRKYNVSTYLLNFARMSGYTFNKNNLVNWSGQELTSAMVEEIFKNYNEGMKVAKHNSMMKRYAKTMPMFDKKEFKTPKSTDIQYHIDKVKAAGYIVSKKIITYQEV
jgi:hypothetical protein